MDGFSVGGFHLSTLPSKPPAPEMPGKSARKESTESQSSPHPNLAFLPAFYATPIGVCFFTKPQKEYENSKVYGISKEPWKHKSSHVFFSKKFHVKSKLGSFDSHPNLFGEVFQVANSFRKHFPELKDNSYQTNRVMEKYLTESIETALETLKGWNILTTNSGGIWTKKTLPPGLTIFTRGCRDNMRVAV